MLFQVWFMDVYGRYFESTSFFLGSTGSWLTFGAWIHGTARCPSIHWDPKGSVSGIVSYWKKRSLQISPESIRTALLQIFHCQSGLTSLREQSQGSCSCCRGLDGNWLPRSAGDAWLMMCSGQQEWTLRAAGMLIAYLRTKDWHLRPCLESA